MHGFPAKSVIPWRRFGSHWSGHCCHAISGKTGAPFTITFASETDAATCDGAAAVVNPSDSSPTSATYFVPSARPVSAAAPFAARAHNTGRMPAGPQRTSPSRAPPIVAVYDETAVTLGPAGGGGCTGTAEVETVGTAACLPP